jgi:hypothetical protein
MARDGATIVIRDVRTLVCNVCGEPSLGVETMSALEQLADTAATAGPRYQIINYAPRRQRT